MDSNNIPKALIYLKSVAGDNWATLRKMFSGYLLKKKKLASANLEIELKKELERLLYRSYIQKLTKINFETELIKTLSLNTLKSLHRAPYSSEWVCFIIDGYNTVKSGNAKYPQFRDENK